MLHLHNNCKVFVYANGECTNCSRFSHMLFTIKYTEYDVHKRVYIELKNLNIKDFVPEEVCYKCFAIYMHSIEKAYIEQCKEQVKLLS